MARNVAVQDDFLYHNPRKLANTRDMEVITEDEALDRGLTACTSCYPNKDQSNIEVVV